MKEELNNLLRQKMDRKEFLKHVGYGTMVLFGLGSIAKVVFSLQNSPLKQSRSSGYGGGAYGE